MSFQCVRKWIDNCAKCGGLTGEGDLDKSTHKTFENTTDGRNKEGIGVGRVDRGGAVDAAVLDTGGSLITGPSFLSRSLLTRSCLFGQRGKVEPWPF